MVCTRFLFALLLLVGCAPSTAVTLEARRDRDGGTLEVPVDAGREVEVVLFDRARISSDGNAPNFHRVRVALPVLDGGPFESVKLFTQLDTTCFPFESWRTNPPPPGHNWPANCDAFDRNYEWRLRDPTADAGTPAIELLRAITPFGGPLALEVDVTDVINGMTAAREVEVEIPTYSDGAGIVSGSQGGWFVSGRLLALKGTPPRRVLSVTPLLYRSLFTADAQQSLAFTVPPGTARTVVEYRATGHGGPTTNAPGCFGPAEEFCTRRFTFKADGQPFDDRQLLRTNCAQLCTVTAFPSAAGGTIMACKENPCGSIGSVRASRANWCPGSVTPALVFEPPSFKTPGAHTFEFTIDRIATGGLWQVSVTVFAYGP